MPSRLESAAEEKGPRMEAILVGIIALLLFIYLFMAVLWPDKF
jgi:K+-transporting ATPase KdpF subunit